MIVEGTLDGLAAARARGRVGGRPPALSQRQLNTAQRIYDAGEHTVEEIAEILSVGRTRKIDPDTNRRFGETGASEKVQLDADRKWYPIAPDLSRWDTDDRGYADVPVGKPLTEVQIAKKLPTLNLSLGDHRPHVRGKIREYVSL